MWNYEKRLEYPINITTPNAKLASYILSQYGGPDGDDYGKISLKVIVFLTQRVYDNKL